MGEAGAISSAGNAVVGVGGDIAGGIVKAKALKTQGQYERQIAEFNARLSDIQGRDAIIRSEKNVVQIRKQKKQVLGAQRAALAAQGLDLSSGSAADVQADTERLAQEDVTEIRSNAWKEAFGFKVEALNYRQGGSLAEMTRRHQAKQTIISGGISGFNKVLSLGSSLAGSSGGGGGGGSSSAGSSSTASRGGSVSASPFTTGIG